jgi:UDP-perosamine 4-acetyltransferase
MKVVGIGAGGHAKVVIEILRSASQHEIVGLVDQNGDLCNTLILGIRVLGNDNLLSELKQQGVAGAFIGVGGVADTRGRRELYEQTVRLGFTVVDAIHTAACVSPSAKLGNGITVMSGAIVGAEAQLGKNVIVNSGAIVEHDCVIGDHVHIAPGAMLSGGANVEEGAHVGIGAVVLQQRRIGAHAVVGAGAVVISDVPPRTTVVGMPARELVKRI